MANPEFNANVNLIEVERVYSSRGSFSIYQANAKDIEHIDLLIEDLKQREIYIDYPHRFEDSTALPHLPHNEVVYDGNEELPVVTYLTGPIPDWLK